MSQEAQNLLVPFRRDKKRDFAVGTGSALLASKVEDMINTVVRQIAFYTFERKVHEARRQGELTPDQIKTFKSPGIPVGDSLNNEAEIWIRASQTAFAGSKMNLMVKGDNNAQYPAFKSVMDAFKKNEIFKFQLITDPENVPVNTPLWKKNMDYDDPFEFFCLET